MSRVFLDGRVTLHHGDSREVLLGLADASIDSVVCDPPYALVSIGKRFGKPGAAAAQVGASGAYARASAGFMGQSWDTGETAFDPAFWGEVLRVLKPGGHAVAFGGTRSYHRLACALEDAGFEIRDQLAWVYGTGFPKSHDVAKGIDKHLGAERRVVGEKRAGLARKARAGGEMAGGAESFEHLRRADITVAATEDASRWEGWGTALKPAWEPIVLARKPLAGTVAESVLAHGTGALNIDGCRIGTTKDVPASARKSAHGGDAGGIYGKFASPPTDTAGWDPNTGRWPANIVHDGSAEVLAAFPQAPGQQRAVGPQHGEKASVNVFGDYGLRDDCAPRGDSGSAARFFYSAKADADSRIGSKHPTVKPVDLMAWLCRLVTPPGGTVLDPFAGSGSTGEAAWREGFAAVLIEREAAYCEDIARRLDLCRSGPAERTAARVKARGTQADAGPLFGAAS